jgi:hypothetical protein
MEQTRSVPDYYKGNKNGVKDLKQWFQSVLKCGETAKKSNPRALAGGLELPPLSPGFSPTSRFPRAKALCVEGAYSPG